MMACIYAELKCVSVTKYSIILTTMCVLLIKILMTQEERKEWKTFCVTIECRV